MFSRSPHLGSILRYICDRYWEGKTDEIKEYNLAVEALGRPLDFDPSLNPIVRVEMHRLRERLKKYYSEGGQHHNLALTLYAGSYIPQFIPRPQDADPAAPASRPGNGAEPEDPRAPAQSSSVVELLTDLALDSGSPESAALRNPLPPPNGNRQNRVGWGRISLIAASVLAILAIIVFSRLHPTRTIKANQSAPRPSASVADEAAMGGAPIRLISGYSKESYTASCGFEFSGDRFFKGGDVRGPDLRYVARTRDPTVFAYGRTGEFSYEIPLKPGPHELWLYFVETDVGPGTVESEGGENRNTFNVDANGKPLLAAFDPYADARGNFIADARVFKDIEPAADGHLHLKFFRIAGKPFLNALVIVPSRHGKMNPIRLVAQNNTFTDRSGQVWDPDRYFRGGRITVRQKPAQGDTDPGVFVGERWGAFDYALPVAEGRYAVTLYFTEAWFGTLAPGGVGSRVFDVYCNGVTLLKNFDIYQEAGGANRSLQKTFHGLQPNAQGKIVLTFVPIKNYACLNAIEVVDESK
ncbi:MAG: malectin domain-containing carbohydrate-binding protein [Terriglobia bacterium]